MKQVLFILVLFFIHENIFSAEYNGKNIDEKTYSCKAFSFENKLNYNAECVFNGSYVSVYFENGYIVDYELYNEIILNPNAISCTNLEDNSYWVLEINTL